MGSISSDTHLPNCCNAGTGHAFRMLDPQQNARLHHQSSTHLPVSTQLERPPPTYCLTSLTNGTLTMITTGAKPSLTESSTASAFSSSAHRKSGSRTHPTISPALIPERTHSRPGSGKTDIVLNVCATTPAPTSSPFIILLRQCPTKRHFQTISWIGDIPSTRRKDKALKLTPKTMGNSPNKGIR